jgi:Tol biopolymer transport system component
LLALGLTSWSSPAAPDRSRVASPGARPCRSALHGLGEIAVVARGRLELADPARCRVSVSRAPGAGEVRFSPDGRWLAYAPLQYGVTASPVLVPLHGGAVRAPLGRHIIAWTWGPRGALLYGVTGTGSLVAAAPGGPLRTLATGIDTGFYGAAGPLVVAPDGSSVAVDRSTCAAPNGEIDTVNLDTGARTVVIRRAGEFLTLAGFSPDGRWLLYWGTTICSASLAADGWPLYAVPASGGSPIKVVRSMLLYDDFLSWCGSELVAAAGPDRETELASKLLSVSPPAWHRRIVQRARGLSWVSPACAPGGRVFAAAAGPSHEGIFGLEHRSIWLLHAGSGAVIRRLTLAPSAEQSDEAPRVSRDGRWIMFVRTRVVPSGSRDTLEVVRTSGGPPVPILDFSSGDFSYYDHFDWPYEIDWYQPR